MPKSIKFEHLIYLTIISSTVMVMFYQYKILEMPFIAPNSWRDAQTFSVSRNFVEENFNILKPRYDIRGDGDGIAPGEFPLFNAIAALNYKLFGVSTYVARATNWLLGVLCVLLIFYVLKYLETSVLLRITAINLFYTNSVLSTQSVSIMPETCSNFFALLSVTSFIFFKNKFLKYLLTGGLLIAASLVKPSGWMVMGMISCLMVCPHNNREGKVSILDIIARVNFTDLVKIIIFSTLTIAPAFLWKEYIMNFSKSVYPGLMDFTHIYNRTLDDIITQINIENIYHVFKKILFHGLNISGTGTLAITAFLFLVNKEHYSFDVLNKNIFRLKIININLFGLFLWFALCVIFLIMTGTVQKVQIYYATPIAIPALLVTIILMKSLKKEVILVLILLQFTGVLYYYNKEFLNEETNWYSYRLETHADEFSTRNDLFLSHTDVLFNFKYLGRIGRRGSNFTTIDHLRNASNQFKFIYINKTEFEYSEELFHEIGKIYGPPIYNVNDDYFFKI